MRQADTEGFTGVAEHYENPFHGDEALPVVFSMHPVQDEAASNEAGRPIFREVEHVRIMVPGDKDNIIFQPVDETHRRRFPRKYAEWKRSGTGEVTEGTPLSAWPLMPRAQVLELAHFGIKTVEQLASLSDANLQRVGPIQALKQKAKDFLAQAKDGSALTQMRAELEKRDAEMAALRQQVEALTRGGGHKGKGA